MTTTLKPKGIEITLSDLASKMAPNASSQQASMVTIPAVDAAHDDGGPFGEEAGPVIMAQTLGLRPPNQHFDARHAAARKVVLLLAPESPFRAAMTGALDFFLPIVGEFVDVARKDIAGQTDNTANSNLLFALWFCERSPYKSDPLETMYQVALKILTEKDTPNDSNS